MHKSLYLHQRILIQNDLCYLIYDVYIYIYYTYLLQPNTCIYLVLSELYQKELLTVEDVSMMRKSKCILGQVLLVQCVKPPEIVAETADVLNALDCTEEATMLRGLYSYSLKMCIYIDLSVLYVIFKC